MQLRVIFYALGIEHVIGFAVALFRAWDVEKNGLLDISGVPRARCESFLEML